MVPCPFEGGRIMRVIRIDDDVWQALKKRAEAFEDTPNSVLRRVLKLNEGRVKRTATVRSRLGDLTPRKAFRRPILRALYEAGGSARTGDVLDRVEELLATNLTDADRTNKASGREPRWRNRAQFEYQFM